MHRTRHTNILSALGPNGPGQMGRQMMVRPPFTSSPAPTIFPPLSHLPPPTPPGIGIWIGIRHWDSYTIRHGDSPDSHMHRERDGHEDRGISYRDLLWYVVEQLLFKTVGKRWTNISFVKKHELLLNSKRVQTIMCSINYHSNSLYDIQQNKWLELPLRNVQREFIQIPIIDVVLDFV